MIVLADDRARIEGRFVVVEGAPHLQDYLGSANILMEPDDQYLCIVSAPKPRDRIFLPFQEDGGHLSVILSKALLLADDDRITDRSIVAQIKQR